MVLVIIPRSIIGHKAEHRVWSHEEEKACKMQQMGIRIFPLWALGTTVGERTTNHNQEKAQRHQGDNKSLDFFLAFVFDNSFFVLFLPLFVLVLVLPLALFCVCLWWWLEPGSFKPGKKGWLLLFYLFFLFNEFLFPPFSSFPLPLGIRVARFQPGWFGLSKADFAAWRAEHYPPLP